MISFITSSVPPPIGPRRASRTARSMPYSRMGAEGAVEIIGRSAIEASDDPEGTREAMLNAVRQQIDPYIAAGNAVIDDIIDPRETRPTIAKALRMGRLVVVSPRRGARSIGHSRRVVVALVEQLDGGRDRSCAGEIRRALRRWRRRGCRRDG